MLFIRAQYKPVNVVHNFKKPEHTDIEFKTGMKKYIILLAILNNLLFLTYNLNAQNTDRNKAVYVELLGPGTIYSVNYDTRLQKRINGLGLRLGISYTPVFEKYLTIPVQFNYLIGKTHKFFEVGLGATYVDYGPLFSDSNPDYSKSVIHGTLLFGYRKLPEKSGLMFRAGISPTLTKDRFIPHWPYISLGYSFD